MLPYFLIAPTLGLVLVVIYAMAQGVVVSLYAPQRLVPRPEEFVGLANYARLLFDPAVYHSLKVTLIYTVACVIGANTLGMAFALLLQANFLGRGIARALITLPWAMPIVATALIWFWIYDYQYGVLNFILSRLGLIQEPILWLAGPQWALFAVTLVDIWMIFPFATVVLLTALQAIDVNLYDAASIDGASYPHMFRYVTLPGIRPTLNILGLLFTIWSLKRFTTIWILTQGGPAGRTDMLVIKVYREAFRNYNAGYASAVALVGLLVALLVTLIYFTLEARHARPAGGPL
jgi:multiple sugar transport system permease protein